MLRHGSIGRVLSARHLAEEREDSLLERGLVGEGNLGEVRGEVVRLRFGLRRGAGLERMDLPL